MDLFFFFFNSVTQIKFKRNSKLYTVELIERVHEVTCILVSLKVYLRKSATKGIRQTRAFKHLSTSFSVALTYRETIYIHQNQRRKSYGNKTLVGIRKHIAMENIIPSGGYWLTTLSINNKHSAFLFYSYTFDHRQSNFPHPIEFIFEFIVVFFRIRVLFLFKQLPWRLCLPRLVYLWFFLYFSRKGEQTELDRNLSFLNISILWWSYNHLRVE